MVNNTVPAEAVLLVAMDQKLQMVITGEQITLDNILLWGKLYLFLLF